MEKRYTLRYVDIDAPEYKEYDSCTLLIDTETDQIVAHDGGEPEDQTLYRDWHWVPELLNKQAEEIASLKEELALLNADVSRLSEKAEDAFSRGWDEALASNQDY